MVEVAVLEEVAEIFASLRDVDAAFARFLELTRRIAGTRHCGIYLRDACRGVFYQWKFEEDQPAGLEFPAEVIEALFASSDQCILPFDLPHLADNPSIKAAQAVGLRVGVGFAMRHGGALVGALAIAFPHSVEALAPALRALTALARFPASAIHHARMQETAERRARLADVLRRFGERALAETDEATLYKVILETTVELTGSDQASVTHVLGDRLRVVAGIGKDEALVGLEAPVDAVKEALSSEAPYIVDDVSSADPNALLIKMARRNGAASFVALPLRHHDRVLGHVFAGAAQVRRYRPEEVEAMRILSSMAAAVIEQRRAEATASREAGRLAAAIEHLPIVIELYNGDGVRMQSNAAARRIRALYACPVGTAQEPLPGLRILELGGAPIDPADYPTAQALRGVRPPTRELEIAAGERRVGTLLVAAAPLLGPDGQTVEAVVVGCQDVSKLHELARTKDGFLRIAAHELRSPITALHATAQLFDLDPSVAVDAQRRGALLARLMRQTARLKRLVEQLLDSVRLNAPELPLQRAPVDLMALCRDVVDTTLTVDGPRAVIEGDPSVIGHWDGLRIEQVLTNLLSNAARYSRPDSEVRVTVRRAGARALLRVSDEGIGIPAQQIDQLFRPFFRASNAGENTGGLGLGLHIAHEIVRRHGGQIRVESRENLGTTFTVELPLD